MLTEAAKDVGRAIASMQSHRQILQASLVRMKAANFVTEHMMNSAEPRGDPNDDPRHVDDPEPEVTPTPTKTFKSLDELKQSGVVIEAEAKAQKEG